MLLLNREKSNAVLQWMCAAFGLGATVGLAHFVLTPPLKAKQQQMLHGLVWVVNKLEKIEGDIEELGEELQRIDDGLQLGIIDGYR